MARVPNVTPKGTANKLGAIAVLSVSAMSAMGAASLFQRATRDVTGDAIDDFVRTFVKGSPAAAYCLDVEMDGKSSHAALVVTDDNTVEWIPDGRDCSADAFGIAGVGAAPTRTPSVATVPRKMTDWVNDRIKAAKVPGKCVTARMTNFATGEQVTKSFVTVEDRPWPVLDMVLPDQQELRGTSIDCR